METDRKQIKNGLKYKKNGWTYISIKGEPKERGYAYGFLVGKDFEEIQKTLQFLCMEEFGREWSFFVENSSRLFNKTIETNFNEFYLEMEGMVEGYKDAGVETTIDEVIAWNNYFSLTGSWYPKEYESSGRNEGGGKDRCSAFICTGEYTTDGKIVSGHNNFSQFADGQYGCQVLDINPSNGGSRMLIQGFLGWIWSGTDFFVSSSGIFGTETTIGGFNGFENKDPLFCRIRNAMQYGETLDDYVSMLLKENSGDYANSWLFGDFNTNEIMRLELGLNYHNVERKSNGYFIGCNVAFDDKLRNLECSNTGFNDIRRHNGSRKVRIPQLMEEYKGKINIEIGKLIMSDHYDVYLKKDFPCSRTICSHYDNDPREFMSDPSRPLPYQPRGAIDGNLIDADMGLKMSFCLKYGRSCDIPFDKEIFFKENPQWLRYKPYIKSRKNNEWTIFTITNDFYKEGSNKTIKNVNKKKYTNKKTLKNKIKENKESK